MPAAERRASCPRCRAKTPNAACSWRDAVKLGTPKAARPPGQRTARGRLQRRVRRFLFVRAFVLGAYYELTLIALIALLLALGGPPAEDEILRKLQAWQPTQLNGSIQPSYLVH